MLPVPTVTYLAQFTGREPETYSPFADQALAQSALLFTIVTGLQELPPDADHQQLAIYAILELADRIYLEQPFAQVKASPMNSETIGSYSYGKSGLSPTAKAAKQGQDTGLIWWDTALEELSQIQRSLVESGSIAVFDRDVRQRPDGGLVIPGPIDMYPTDLIPPGGQIEMVPLDQARLSPGDIQGWF